MASRRKRETPRKRQLWQENHGNFLAAFAGLILILGIATILYQQMRFRPPAFPRRMPDPVEPSVSSDEDPNATSEPIGDTTGPAVSPEAETEVERSRSILETPAAEEPAIPNADSRGVRGE